MSLIPLDQIPTLPLLYRLQRIALHSPPVHAARAQHNAKVALIRNDITKLKVDSIVNAANESLLGGGGVDGAIHRAAGPRLLRECHKLDGCDTGSAKITDAYELPCKKVIHAVGPVYYSAKRQGTHEKLLRGCYRTSLELAEANGLTSIAFSALSTGVYGYPSKEAAEAAISEVRNFLDEGQAKTLTTIIFCNFLAKDEDAYHELLPKYFPPDEVSESESESKGDELRDKLSQVTANVLESDGTVLETKKKQKTSHETEDEDRVKSDKADEPQRASIDDAVNEGRGKI